MKKRSVSARGCRFEQLEARQLMAGDVFARIDRGNLIIRGDDLANAIQVTAGPNQGQVVITGLNDAGGNATRVNNASNGAITLNGFNGQIEVAMNGGNDLVRVTGLANRGVLADLGRGNDDFTLDDQLVRGDVSIKTSDGDDSVQLALNTINGSIVVDMGEGTNELRSTNDNVSRDGKFLSGRGSDSITLLSLTVGGTAYANFGDGTNTFDGLNISANRVEYKGGRNNDDVYFEAGQVGSILVEAGQGTNKVDLHGLRVLRDARIIGGSNDDQFVADEATVFGNAYFDLGDGNNSLHNQWNIRGDVVVRGGRGMDTVNLDGRFADEIVYRSLKVELGDGTNSLTIQAVDVAGKAEVKAGKDTDSLSVTDAALDSLYADLGGGTNSFNLGTSAVKRDLTFKSGSGTDSGEISFSTVGGNTVVELGDGNNGFFGFVSSIFSGDVTVLGGSGSDSPFFHQVQILKSLKLDLGDGSNVFSVLVLRVSRRTEYEGGKGFDQVELVDIRSASLNVALGKGNDLLQLASVTTTQSTKFDGGEGQDTYSVAPSFPSTLVSLERKSFEIFTQFFPA